MSIHKVIYGGASKVIGRICEALNKKIDEPESDGSAGQVLSTDGAGGRSWKTVESKDTNTTYTLSLDGENLALTGSDGSAQTVILPTPETSSYQDPPVFEFSISTTDTAKIKTTAVSAAWAYYTLTKVPDNYKDLLSYPTAFTCKITDGSGEILWLTTKAKFYGQYSFLNIVHSVKNFNYLYFGRLIMANDSCRLMIKRVF